MLFAEMQKETPAQPGSFLRLSETLNVQLAHQIRDSHA